MPAVSRNQQVAAAIAEHHPDKLYKRNRGLLEMEHDDLHEYASTKRRRLPQRARDAVAEAQRRALE